MKKAMSLLLVTLFASLAFSACGGSDSSSQAAPSSKPPASQPPASQAPASQAPASQAPAAQDAAAAPEETYSLDFTLYNFSNADLVDIRLSSSEETTFGENLLQPGYVLGNESYVDIVFDSTAPAGTTFDMYTLDSDGDEYEYYEIPLTQITDLYLYVEFYDDGTYNNYYEYE
ncbi:hypothetical protein LJC49_02840 [Ruminococcaceae bacterium OttesenSCG-928-I18]|nr:hypothetical protein [Ruminococcaceae bacterium OttesenSCG-928-I18]